MLVTQEELDRILNGKRPPESIASHKSGIPAEVPRTWTEVGLSAPAGELGPQISQEELEAVLRLGVDSRPAPAIDSSTPAEAPAGLLVSAERTQEAAETVPDESAMPAASVVPEASTAVSQAVSAPVDDDPALDVRSRLIASIKALPQGIELPAALFSQIVESLSLLKASFLLYDPLRLVYAPWASIGYDETTLHRLRISLGACSSFNSISNGTPAVVSGADDLLPYQKYFSSREFSQISTILLVPFIHEEKLIGVVMISESQGALAGTQDLIDILSAVASESAPMIHSAREEKLRSLPSSQAEGDRGERELDSFLESAHRDNRKVLILSLSLSGLSQAIMGRAAHIDSFRLREDMRTILNGFLADLGKAIALPAGKDTWVLAVLDGRKTDVPVLLHQLAAHLERIFAGVDASHTINPVTARCLGWPDECADIREILSRLTA